MRGGRGRHRGARGPQRRARARRRLVRLLRRRGVRGGPHLRRDDPRVRGAPGLVTGGRTVPADPAPIYEVLRNALQADEPVALATITEGPGTGAKLLVRPGHPVLGTLGDEELDRVVARDALAELD